MAAMAFAFSLTLAGASCLYGSWRRLALFKPWGKPAGWMLLLLSCWLWTRASNIEFGISYALMAVALCAWALVLFNYELRQQKQSADNGAASLVLPRASTLLRHGLMFLLAIPLAGLMAAYLSTALVTLLPWQLGNALVLAMLLMPVVWGAGAYWSLADPKLLRPTIGQSLLLGLSLLILYT